MIQNIQIKSLNTILQGGWTKPTRTNPHGQKPAGTIVYGSPYCSVGMTYQGHYFSHYFSLHRHYLSPAFRVMSRTFQHVGEKKVACDSGDLSWDGSILC